MAKKQATSKRSKTLPGVKIVKDDTGVEVLADAIVRVSNAARALLGSRLSKRAIEALILDSVTGVTRKQVSLVLDAAANLDRNFLK